MRRRIEVLLIRCMSIKVISVVFLYFQLFNTGTTQCTNTGISKLFGEISYLPVYTSIYERRTCSWQFKPPSTEEFILIFKLHYVVSYNRNDIISLPDSSVLPKQTLYYGQPYICMKYVMYSSEMSYDCLKNIENLHCPGVDLKLIDLPIRLSVVTIPEHEPLSELVYYTNFQLTYAFAFCRKSATGENQTKEVHDAVLQFEDDEKNLNQATEKPKEVLYNQDGEIVDSLGQVVGAKPESDNYDSTPTVLFIVFVILSVFVITTLYFKIRKHKDSLLSLLNFIPKPTSFDNIVTQRRNQNASASKNKRQSECCRLDHKYSSNEACEGRAEEIHSADFSDAFELTAPLCETSKLESVVDNEISEPNSSFLEKGTRTIETTSEEICKSSTEQFSTFSVSNVSSLASDAYITSNEDRFENAAETAVRRDEKLLNAASHEPLVIPCQTKRLKCDSANIKKQVSKENVQKEVKEQQNIENNMEGFNCEPLDLSICVRKK